MFCVVLRPRRKRTGCPQALLQLFCLIFFNEPGMHSSWEAKQRNIPVVGAFTHVSLVVYGDDQWCN